MKKKMQFTLEILGGRLRVRQKQPIDGAKYRTQDVGGRGHSQRISMYNPVTKRWFTQSWTFPIADILTRRPDTVKILKRLGRWEEAYKFVKTAQKKHMVQKTPLGIRAPQGQPVEESPKTHQPTEHGKPQSEKPHVTIVTNDEKIKMAKEDEKEAKHMQKHPEEYKVEKYE